MKTKMTVAAVALMAAATTTATAGNVLGVGTSDPEIVVRMDDETGAILPTGSLGGNSVVVPVLLTLAIIAAVNAGGGS